MAPHPGIDVNQISSKVRHDLFELLESVPGKKNLVIEKSLADPLGLFVKFSALQEHGVTKLFLLENDNVDASQKSVIFLASGEKASNVVAISNQVSRLQKQSSFAHEFLIVWTPRRTLVSDKLLEDAGVLGDVNIEVLPLYFLPLENDILSLCYDDAFGQMYLRKDDTAIYLAAKALMGLQAKHGLFPRIIGKGDHAHKLMNLILHMRSEAAAEDDETEMSLMPSAYVESLIIIDREIDFVTPLLTQLTYEGVIEEVFGIHFNQIEVDTSIIGTAKSTAQGSKVSDNGESGLKSKVPLDSSDKLFGQLRDSNFAIVDGLLSSVARRLQSEMQSRHEAKTTAELRDFVNKLPNYQTEQQSLKLHISLTEEMLKHTQSDIFRCSLGVQQNLVDGTDPSSQHDLIEELIARDVSLSTILRLLCLESCVAGGLRQKDLDTFKRLITQAYGYQHLLTLNALEKAGLLQVRASANILFNPLGAATGTSENSRTNYNYLRKVLRLIVDEVDEQNPNDVAYVYSGYAPLSVRLVQIILQKQYVTALARGPPSVALSSIANNPTSSGSNVSQAWQGFDTAMNNIKGTTFSRSQRGEEAATKARNILQGNANGKVKTVIVMFLGGITHAEISALRFLAKQEQGRRQILICTTGIVSGRSIIQSLMEEGDFSLTSSLDSTG